MTILKNFGFEIYRLRQVKEQDEFLILDLDNNDFNQYNEKRLIKMLDKELYNKGIDYLNIAVNELSYNEKTKKELLLKEWVFKEYNLIHNLSYKPVDELIFKDENKEYFNLYRKTELLRQENIKGDYPNIKLLLMNLVGNNETEYLYFIKWLGWIIQNPLQRLPTSIILQGEQGTGKTKFCELILKKIFDKNFCEIGQSDINKEYNDFILGKQIIVANEVIHNDNKFLVPDKLKNFVTDEYLSINRKFKDTIYTRNFAQWIFVTNNDMPLKIEKGDRRYTIFKSKKLVNGSKLIGDLLKNLDNELNHFLYDLKTIKVSFNEVSHPILNEAKVDIIKLSQNSVEEFLDYILDIGGIDIFANQYNADPKTFLFSSEDGSCIPTDSFYELYVKYCVQGGITHRYTRRNFTSQLKKLGFNDKVTKIDNESKRVIVIAGKVNG